jgi:hypothetical protein
LKQEELSKYGKKKLRSRFKDDGENIIGLGEFYHVWLKKEDLETVIGRVREYLELILDAAGDKRMVVVSLEEIGVLPQLSGNPSLLKEELDDVEGGNEYDLCYRELEKEVLRRTEADSRRAEVLEIGSDGDLMDIAKPLRKRVDERREQKRLLLKELDD